MASKIEDIWVFLNANQDGDEKITGIQVGGVKHSYLIALNNEMLENAESLAQRIADEHGVEIICRHFTVGVDVKTIKPTRGG